MPVKSTLAYSCQPARYQHCQTSVSPSPGRFETSWRGVFQGSGAKKFSVLDRWQIFRRFALLKAFNNFPQTKKRSCRCAIIPNYLLYSCWFFILSDWPHLNFPFTQSHLIKFLQTFAQQQCYPSYLQALNAQERHTLSKIGIAS